MSRVLKALSVLIRGRVQGVGFRPAVYRHARRCGISGWIANAPAGALMEIEGDQQAVRRFLKELRRSMPPQARITDLQKKEIPVRNFTSFTILQSRKGTGISADIPPDLALCESCEKELFSSIDRRYRYPFINCTGCGPRYSIIRELPYDRPLTTMASFRMCPECKSEYENPADRRFHAQPDACAVCGPQVRLLSPSSRLLAKGATAVERTAELLSAGAIVAVKSIGGYHLACDAFSPEAVAALRQRKMRLHKPLALMMPGLAAVRKFCELSGGEAKLLLSLRRPILLLRKKHLARGGIASAIAPGNVFYGVMLPSTPLQQLLFYGGNATARPRFEALVMTSGNRRNEPICRTEKEAMQKLAGIADYFLVNDRVIHNRCDDSILQRGPGNGRLFQFIRRSRGYVPEPVRLPVRGSQAPVVFAAGAELKNTFCLTRGNNAYVSPHIGDLTNAEALAFYREAAGRFSRFLNVTPRIIAHDLHPDYLSSEYARRLAGRDRTLIRIPVQHHEAHIASVMAEKRLDAPLIGFAFDGTGYGTDGAVWGGECFLYKDRVFRRAAHFEYFPLPGGDRAAREIWRLAVALLHHYGLAIPAEISRRFPAREIIGMIEKGVNTPMTSSVGRLFDAVAALAGIRQEVSFEAQAAIELESLSLDKISKKEYNFNIFSSPLTVSLKRTFAEIMRDRSKGVSAGAIGARFHATIASATVKLARILRDQHGISAVVLGGGVFQNRLLLFLADRALRNAGFTVYYNTLVPPNDGGLSLGQAWIALRQFERK